MIIALLGFLLAAEENQSQPHALAEPLDCTRGDDSREIDQGPADATARGWLRAQKVSRLTLIRNVKIENLVESQWVDLIMDLVGGC